MKINKVWISKFRNIENQWFNFDDNKLVTLLLGQNGLGKSNLIEALSIIFRQLDLAKSIEDFKTGSELYSFDFEIIYSCNKSYVAIQAKNEIVEILVGADENSLEEISLSKFQKNKDEYLPNFILSYYSGENKRSQQIFLSHQKRRFNALKKEKHDFPILGRMFYTEQNFGELLFFVLWVFKDSPYYQNKINTLLKKFLKIELTSKVEIALKNPEFFDRKKHIGITNIEENAYNYLDELWFLKGDVGKLVKILYENNLETRSPLMYEDKINEESKDEYEILYFNELRFDLLHQDIIKEFKSPAKLFDVLEAANRLGIIHEIKATLSKNNQSVRHSFSMLSEGEQQILTILGLVLITGEHDTLFLLDEPDTHLNPTWQREYSSLLHEFNLNDDNSQIIVATHSPLIVQSAERADIFLFRKNGHNNIVIDKNEHKIHNWRIDQVLLSEYFNLPTSRPKQLDDLMKRREEILSKNSLEQKDYDELKEIDKNDLPTGESFTDIETLRFLRSIADKLE